MWFVLIIWYLQPLMWLGFRHPTVIVFYGDSCAYGSRVTLNEWCTGCIFRWAFLNRWSLSWMDTMYWGVSLGNEVYCSVSFCSFGHFLCIEQLCVWSGIVAFTKLSPYLGKDLHGYSNVLAFCWLFVQLGICRFYSSFFAKIGFDGRCGICYPILCFK